MQYTCILQQAVMADMVNGGIPGLLKDMNKVTIIKLITDCHLQRILTF